MEIRNGYVDCYHLYEELLSCTAIVCNDILLFQEFVKCCQNFSVFGLLKHCLCKLISLKNAKVLHDQNLIFKKYIKWFKSFICFTC